jgi:hypothetical protein
MQTEHLVGRRHGQRQRHGVVLQVRNDLGHVDVEAATEHKHASVHLATPNGGGHSPHCIHSFLGENDVPVHVPARARSVDDSISISITDGRVTGGKAPAHAYP